MQPGGCSRDCAHRGGSSGINHAKLLAFRARAIDNECSSLRRVYPCRSGEGLGNGISHERDSFLRLAIAADPCGQPRSTCRQMLQALGITVLDGCRPIVANLPTRNADLGVLSRNGLSAIAIDL